MWDIFSKLLNIVLGLLTVYLIFENKKLKRFEIDRDISIKKVETDELKQQYNAKIKEINSLDVIGKIISPSEKIKQSKNITDEFDNKMIKLNA